MMTDTQSLALNEPAWPLAGHRSVVRHLVQAILNRRVAHAYLITGPEGSGRATLARQFAATLVCQTPAGEAPAQRPCGLCLNCRKIERGVHPDIETISLESQQTASEARGTRNRNITIESIRGLRERLILRPSEGAWRVAIIEDAETMSGGGGLPAASALLKTLEEPPSYAVIILIAGEAEAVLPTLRSRCQPITLSLVRRAEISAFLVERLGLVDEVANELAGWAGGRPGWAIAAARDPSLVEARQASLSRALDWLRADQLTRLQLADEWATRFSRADWRQAEADLDLLIGCWRDLALTIGGSPHLALDQSLIGELGAVADRLDLAGVARALAATRLGAQRIRQNVNARLALEAMVLDWP